MTGQTVILSRATRPLAHHLVEVAADGYVLSVRHPSRTLDQNAKMWAMLSDISRAKPEGRKWPVEWWKAGFMAAMGHEILWQPGLDDGPPFPVGFRSSRLSVGQMADLITHIQEYGDRHNVKWTVE